MSALCLWQELAAAGQVDGPASKGAVLACIIVDVMAVALDVGKGGILVADGSHIGIRCELPAALSVERDGGTVGLIVFVQ